MHEHEDGPRTLYLMRHGKAWADMIAQTMPIVPLMDKFNPIAAHMRDKYRILTMTGEEQSSDIGKQIAEGDLPLDYITASAAIRTLQTMQGVLKGLGRTGEAMPTGRASHGLYNASADDLLTHIQQIDDSHRHVMVIAHFPGIADLALSLSSPPAKIKRTIEAFPEADVCVLSVNAARWSDLSASNARFEKLLEPRVEKQPQP